MKISTKWKNIIAWVSSFVGTIAFILVGGYIWQKGTEEEKNNLKNVFIVHLVFIAVGALITLVDTLAFSIFGASYSSGFYNFWRIFKALVVVASLITHLVFVIIELTKKEFSANSNETKTQTLESKQTKVKTTKVSENTDTEKSEN